MINCDKFFQQLSAFIEGEASEEHKKMINAHISTCPSCTKVLTNVRLVRKSLKNLPKVAATSNFGKKLHEKLARETAMEKLRGLNRLIHSVRSLPVKPVVVTIAAAAAIAFAVVMLESFGNNDKTVYSPRIEIPPVPGSNRLQTLQQQNKLGSNLSQIGSFYASDSSFGLFKNRIGDNSLQEDLLRSLRDQMLPVKNNKH